MPPDTPTTPGSPHHDADPAQHPRLAARLRALALDPAPPALDDRVLAAADALLHRRPRRRVPWLALAAVVLLGATIGLYSIATYAPQPPLTHATPVVTILDAFAAARTADAAPHVIDDLVVQAVQVPLDDEHPAAAPWMAQQPRFLTLALTLDPQGKPLAAYQVRVKVDGAAAAVVGVEAGEGPAFGAAPPYHDRRVLDRAAAEQIVLAMFTTADPIVLPAAPVRVATLHVMVDAAPGAPAPQFTATVEAAADPAGAPIPVTATLQEGTR